MDIDIVFFISVIYRYDEVEPKALLDSGPFKYLFYFIKTVLVSPLYGKSIFLKLKMNHTIYNDIRTTVNASQQGAFG